MALLSGQRIRPSEPVFRSEFSSEKDRSSSLSFEVYVFLSMPLMFAGILAYKGEMIAALLVLGGFGAVGLLAWWLAPNRSGEAVEIDYGAQEVRFERCSHSRWFVPRRRAMLRKSFDEVDGAQFIPGGRGMPGHYRVYLDRGVVDLSVFRTDAGELVMRLKEIGRQTGGVDIHRTQGFAIVVILLGMVIVTVGFFVALWLGWLTRV